MLGEKYAIALGEWAEGIVPTDPEVLNWLMTGTVSIPWAGGYITVELQALFGGFGDGAVRPGLGVGNADLEANIQGLAFWMRYMKEKASLKFDICDYVNSKWDENKNPNSKPGNKPVITR